MPHSNSLALTDDSGPFVYSAILSNVMAWHREIAHANCTFFNASSIPLHALVRNDSQKNAHMRIKRENTTWGSSLTTNSSHGVSSITRLAIQQSASPINTMPQECQYHLSRAHVNWTRVPHIIAFFNFFRWCRGRSWRLYMEITRFAQSGSAPNHSSGKQVAEFKKTCHKHQPVENTRPPAKTNHAMPRSRVVLPTASSASNFRQSAARSSRPARYPPGRVHCVARTLTPPPALAFSSCLNSQSSRDVQPSQTHSNL